MKTKFLYSRDSNVHCLQKCTRKIFIKLMLILFSKIPTEQLTWAPLKPKLADNFDIANYFED